MRFKKVYAHEEYSRISETPKSIPSSEETFIIKYDRSSHFFFALVYLSNGHRPGPLCNMKVWDYLRMENCPDGDTNLFKIRVDKHKTSATHEHIEIVLDDEIKKYFDIYYEYLRSRLDKELNDFFFPNANGKQVRTSDQSHFLKMLIS